MRIEASGGPVTDRPVCRGGGSRGGVSTPIHWAALRLGLMMLIVGMPARALGQEYQVDLEKDRRVRFVSDAPLEDFEGLTNRIDGFLFLAGEGLAGNTDLDASEFYLEVDLADLDTGIGLRNRHMRENYLGTDEFPYATFRGRVTRLEEMAPGQYRAQTSGTFSVHGVDQPREIECSALQVGPSLEVRCEFQVLLSDHGIPIPKLMFMKIDEVMELDLEFFLSPAGNGEGGQTMMRVDRR